MADEQQRNETPEIDRSAAERAAATGDDAPTGPVSPAPETTAPVPAASTDPTQAYDAPGPAVRPPVGPPPVPGQAPPYGPHWAAPGWQQPPRRATLTVQLTGLEWAALIVGGIGTLLAFVSFLLPWATLTVQSRGIGPEMNLWLGDLGGSQVYAVGILLLTGLGAAAFFVTPRVGRILRIVGVLQALGLLAVLAGTLVKINDMEDMIQGLISPIAVGGPDELRGLVNFSFDAGVGLVIAFVATIMLGLALGLAHRRSQEPTSQVPTNHPMGRPAEAR